MNVTDVKSWSDAAQKHGVVAVLLVILVLLNAAGAYLVFKEIPSHLAAIREGYDQNAEELNQAAEKFAGAALGILNEYKADRLADRQAMIELIRAGDLDSSQVADAFEAATEKAGSRSSLPRADGSG